MVASGSTIEESPFQLDSVLDKDIPGLGSHSTRLPFNKDIRASKSRACSVNNKQLQRPELRHCSILGLEWSLLWVLDKSSWIMYNTECIQIGFKMFLFDAWAFFPLLFYFLCTCIKTHWHVPMITFKSLHSFSIVCMKSLCHRKLQKTLHEEGLNEDLATSPS